MKPELDHYIGKPSDLRKLNWNEMFSIASAAIRELNKTKEFLKETTKELNQLNLIVSGPLQEAQKREVWKHLKPNPVTARLQLTYGNESTIESLVVNTPNVPLESCKKARF